MKRLVAVCITVLAALTLLMSTAHAGTAVTVHFGYKSAALSPNSQSQLSQLALDLKHLKSVLVTAYVPDVGDVSLNQQFADQRTAAVKAYLEQQGVPVNVITTQSIPGPASKSRRVEISYGTAAAAMTPSAPPPPVTASAPPPAPMAPPPASEPAAAPPPPPPAQPSEPVITAKPEKNYDSGLKEVDVTDKAYRGNDDTPPSRWEY